MFYQLVIFFHFHLRKKRYFLFIDIFLANYIELPYDLWDKNEEKTPLYQETSLQLINSIQIILSKHLKLTKKKNQTPPHAGVEPRGRGRRCSGRYPLYRLL